MSVPTVKKRVGHYASKESRDQVELLAWAASHAAEMAALGWSVVGVSFRRRNSDPACIWWVADLRYEKDAVLEVVQS